MTEAELATAIKKAITVVTAGTSAGTNESTDPWTVLEFDTDTREIILRTSGSPSQQRSRAVHLFIGPEAAELIAELRDRKTLANYKDVAQSARALLASLQAGDETTHSEQYRLQYALSQVPKGEG